jgi:hypothetical protein
MGWTWAFYCDFQLHLLIPLYCVVYMRSRNVGHFLMGFLIFANLAGVFIACQIYDFKAGLVNTEGYYMYAYMINKPYTKLSAQCVGVLFGIMYWDLLKYRKIEDEEEKKR